MLAHYHIHIPLENIYLINHPSLYERYSYQTEQFSTNNMMFHLIKSPTLTGKTNFINKYIKSLFLSHIQALEQAKIFNKPCMIAEDDILICNFAMFLEFLNQALEYIDDWNMLYFEHDSDSEHYIKQPKTHLYRINNLINRSSHLFNTHAYIVNPQFIPQLLTRLYEHVIQIESAKLQPHQSKLSHIDQFYVHCIHPYCSVYSPNIDIIIQNQLQFGSSLQYPTNTNVKKIKI